MSKPAGEVEPLHPAIIAAVGFVGLLLIALLVYAPALLRAQRGTWEVGIRQANGTERSLWQSSDKREAVNRSGTGRP